METTPIHLKHHQQYLLHKKVGHFLLKHCTDSKDIHDALFTQTNSMHLQWGFFVNVICTKCSSCKNVNPPTILYVTIICVTNNEQCWIFHAYKKAKLLFIAITKSRMLNMYSSAVTLSKEFF